MSVAGRLLALAGVLAACQPTTTRPAFTPVPEADTMVIRLRIPEATQRLAEALRADSIPLARVSTQDGYLESPWFEAGSGKATRRRPIGPQIVRVRGWVDPDRPGYSRLSVETMYRPLADPSLPERELEREVPRDHPVAAKVRASLVGLVKRYGGPPVFTPAEQRPQPARREGEEPEPYEDGGEP